MARPVLCTASFEEKQDGAIPKPDIVACLTLCKEVCRWSTAEIRHEQVQISILCKGIQTCMPWNQQLRQSECTDVSPNGKIAGGYSTLEAF